MTDLAEFLLARIAEDEAVARNSHPFAKWWVDGPAAVSGQWLVYDAGAKCKRQEDAEHIARHDPARVLAECAAKRRMIHYWPDSFGQWGADQAAAASQQKVHTLQLLALPYADHPDYREGWRP